jgi:NAD(P)-dependent dehydrogenase (short-subunit alcohol dehydrogenase family)
VRNQKAAEDLAAAAKQEGLTVELCRADLTSSSGLEQVRKAVDATGEPLSAIVHCAATGVHRPIEELTTRHFDWTLSLNARVFFELVKAFVNCMAARSSVVAISSLGASRALPYYSLVGASKGALDALARHFAVELAPRGIRVNILTPGTISTDVWRVLPQGEDRVAEAIRRSPTKRLVTCDEVAAAAQFLCSEAAAGIVGHTLVVDGGAAIAG